MENQRTITHGQGRQARLSGERLLICNSVRLHLSMASHAYADDFAVAASSFRTLMFAHSPAFKVVDQIAGLDLDHQKCCWVQCGSENCRDLLGWVSTNCEDFREMKIVKCA